MVQLIGAAKYRLNDDDIRSALLSELALTYGDKRSTRIVEELGLRHGLARVDIAVINDSIEGIEIKSDRDSLDRLSDQMEIYNSVLDRITLVVGRAHLDRACAIVPEWWGIRLADLSDVGTLVLYRLREPEINPVAEIGFTVKLLWRDEALLLLSEIGKARGSRAASRAKIYSKLVDSTSPEWLHSKITRQLLARRGWRADLPQM